ncbi:MAG: DUF2851 family protein [Dehalococcoidia bacterium]
MLPRMYARAPRALAATPVPGAARPPDAPERPTLRERPALRERPETYVAGDPAPFPESTLTALWLLGRVPGGALPWPLLHAGRAGRGPGPDVRDATFLGPSGATLAGDVEVHLRATDFARHGHAEDPGYAGVVLHLCWEDDRAAPGTPTPLPGGGAAPTVALRGVLTARDVERLVTLGPDVATTAPPCADTGREEGHGAAESVVDAVRAEGRRRLAERTWRAWRLADRYGFDGAFTMLLDRALASTAGRVHESEERRATLSAAILAALGPDAVEALAEHALASRTRPGGMPGGRAGFAEVLRVEGVGAARAAELAWNAALPLVAALAAAYDDIGLARATAALAEGWPAPRPYGRTRALASALGATPARGRAGALYAQGLLHLQDLWCSRGGCGVCPLSPRATPGEA